MKSVFTGIFGSAVLLCGICTFSGAQAATPSTAPQPQQSPAPGQAVPASPAQTKEIHRIAPGSVIPVQLTKSIDAKKVKTGDEVDAKVTGDLKAANGDVVVPKDTKVVGHVTEAQARSKEQKESQVGIAFDHAVMKDGGDMTMPMSVQAIISQSYLSGGNNGGGGQSAGQPSSIPSSVPSSGGMGGGGRNPGAEAPQTSMPAGGTSDVPASTARQPITGNTQGVLGLPDVKLSTAAEPTQGSVVSSEKNNVKLESGTLLLLRVSQ